MKSSYVIAGILALAVGGWIASGQFDGNAAEGDGKAESAATDVPAAEAKPVKVRVRLIQGQQRVNELVLFGRTEADRKVDMRAETAGSVSEILVKKGDAVKEGQILLRLAMEDRPARLKQAEALVQQRQIAYDAAIALSEKNYRSKVKLAEEKANLEAAKAALENIRTDIGHTRIRAPFAGVIDDLPLEIGDYVKVGDQAVRLIDLDPILVVGEVAERDVQRVRPGAVAHARLVTGQEVAGTVRFVSKMGTQSTRTFRVEVAVENPGGEIAEGLTAELRLPLSTVIAHLVSPAVLTLDDNGTVGVKTVDDQDTVRFHAVELVADTSEGIWLKGLPEAARVITVGQEFVSAGQKVVPVPETAIPGKVPAS
ncbi:MAG: efflux RND transporter periplasmic adaptor subunit [Hyphomicrobiales bacterium]|nr:efflux RND transporter periplasmic adaptor subunit [Hyphomicrobiales bacterium]